MPTTKKTAAEEVSQGLIKALAHPERFHALHVLSKQPTASPKELAQIVGTDLGKMSYHVRELAKYGCIELVRTEPRRGATEHYYRATQRAFFSDAEWVKLPVVVRKGIVGMQLTATGKLISESLAAGNFEARANRHHSLLEMDVDETGWQEVVDVLEDALTKLIEIRALSAERLMQGDFDRIPIAISMLGFERAG